MKTKLKIFFLCCCFGFCMKSKGQVGYGFDTPIKGYCQPGVDYKSKSKGLDFSYQRSGGGQLIGETNGLGSYQLNSINAFTFKLKVPVLLKPQLKILVGYSHQPEANQFGTFLGSNNPLLQSIDGLYLKNQGLSFYAINSLNSTDYLALRFKVSSSGDFNGFLNFDNQFVIYSAQALFGIKRSGDLEYGIGLSFNRNARRTQVLPFLLFNKNFSKKWGFEGNIPAKMNLRYNLNRETIILLGSELDSRNFGVNLPAGVNELDNPRPYLYNQLSVQAGITVQRQLVPWVWLNFKSGYLFNFSTRLFSLDGTDQLLKYKPPNSVYFTMGFFLSPP